jgi:hypothetical protein
VIVAVEGGTLGKIARSRTTINHVTFSGFWNFQCILSDL